MFLLSFLPNQRVNAQDSTLVEASIPIQLNANLPADGEVTDFKISPDNLRVVYIADQNQDDVFELYSANLDGSGAPIRLSRSNPVSGGDVLSIVGFSEDGSRVVYTADHEQDERQDVYSVTLDATSRIRLSPNRAEARTIPQAEISPDKSRVVYILNVGGGFTEPHHIYSSSILGGAAALLSDRTSEPLQVQDFRFSNDGTKVVFLARLFVVAQLNIANLDGAGVSRRVDEDRGADGGVTILSNYMVSDDNSHVVFLADKNVVSRIELFSVNLSTNSAVRLNSDLPSGVSILDFRLDRQDNLSVYYIAKQFDPDVEEVFRANLSGGPIARVSPPASGNSSSAFIVNSINKASIIPYLFTDRSSTPKLTLRGIDIDSNTDVLVSDTTATTDLFILKESPSSEFLTFLSRDLGELNQVIYGFRLGENVTNNRVLISEFDSNTLPNYIREVSENDKIVLYEADDRSDSDIQNIFASSLTNGAPVQINPTLPTGADIRTAAISSNGEYAVYIADQSNVGTFNIYGSKITLNDLGGDDLCVPIKANNGFAVICL